MNLLSHLSIKMRLSILVGLVLILMFVSAGFVLNSLSQSNDSIETLYKQGMAHTQRIGKVIGLLNDVHTELLLTLQHEPGSAFAAMHDHPAQKHLDNVNRDLAKIHENWQVFATSELEPDEQVLVKQFEAGLGELENSVKAIAAEIAAGDFQRANALVLSSLKQAMGTIDGTATADKLLSGQMAEAAAIFEAAEVRYSRSTLTAATILGVALVVGVLLSGITITGIASAVRELDNAATQLAAGDLRARANYTGHDELRHVADSFNAVAESFKVTVSTVSEAVARVTVAANQSSSVSGQTLQGIESQQQETEQVATAMNEMNATVHDVAQNASSAADAARAADEAANEGRNVVQTTVQAIDRLASEVEQANGVIGKLKQESEQIGSVLDVIRNIAEQTNLLALNAAIEAARAGEQGRGFAVVADEVRTLASRTQQSTQEIDEMISRLQSGANDAVKAMDVGRTQAKAGVEQAAVAGQSLDAITAAVDRITEMNMQIASAVEEQSAVAEEINRNLHNISEVSTRNFHGAEENAQAANELAALSNDLQGRIARFRF